MAKSAKERAKADSPRRTKLPEQIVVPFVKAVTLVGLLIAFYVITFFSAIRVVPMIMGFVASGSGVTSETPFQTVVAVWLAPSLFLMALLFALVIVTMRALWRARARVVAIVQARFATDETTVNRPLGRAVPVPANAA